MRGTAVPGPRGSFGEVWLGIAAVSFPHLTRGPSLVPYPLPFAFLNSCPFLFSLKLLPAFPTQGLWCGVSKTRLDSFSTSVQKPPDAVTSKGESACKRQPHPGPRRSLCLASLQTLCAWCRAPGLCIFQAGAGSDLFCLLTPTGAAEQRTGSGRNYPCLEGPVNAVTGQRQAVTGILAATGVILQST